ncbi:FRRS1-like protein, partial [Mya arenaria]
MLVLLALLLLQAYRAEGYGTGPPLSACDSMTPTHESAAQTGISPYQLTVAKNTYSPSEQIQVTLTGTSTFGGFMIQPRLQSNTSTATYGTISPNDTVNTNNPYTVVQVKSTFWVKLESSSLTYQAPSQAPTSQEPTTQAPTTQEPTTQAPTSQKPTTQAPTTQEPNTQALTSQKPTTQAPTTQEPNTQAPTSQKPTTQTPTSQEPTTQAPTTQEPTTQAPTSQKPTTQAPTSQEPTTPAPTIQEPTTKAPTSQKPTTQAPTTQEPTTQAPTTQELATQIDRDPNCDVSLNCFPAMDECSTNCDYLVTWREVSDTDVEFSLKRKTTNNNYYIAIGFSEDLQMGDDSVVQCVSTDGAVGVKSSYNVPGADKYNDDLDEITFGVSLINGSYSDGVLSCTFNRKKDADLASAGSGRRRRATSNASSFFNLTKEYFLLVALGEAFGGSISQHSEKPKISTTKIDFLALPDVNNTETTTAVATKTGKITRDDGCGKNLGCFHDGCKGGECDFLLTWKDVGDDVELSFSCKMSKNGYCAIGLSSDEKMGDDSVFECVSDDGNVNVYVSYNNGRSNSRLDQDQYGLSSITTSGNNGVITCSFRRQKVAPSRRKRASRYLSQHATTPLVSKQVADFQTFQEIGADSADRLLIKLHGILMVLAWMLLASIGITMARFYKEVWPEGMEWFQLKRWFVVKSKQSTYEMKTYDENMQGSPKKKVNNIKIGFLIVH